ncbi:MAG TPA: DUF3887 domain-containing protein, partial [Candidatus Limnocylindria bacterium]|nr:DUF3887 domain-containing protein [Candidatus Limnocylindria bacterium]
MKKFFLLALAALLLTTAILAPASASGADAGAAFMELLAGGAYAEAFDRSDDAMRGAVMSAEGYAAMWQGLLLQFGEYEGAQDLGASEAGGYATHDVQASFARARVRFDVIFNSEGKLAGMRVTALEAREAEREQTGEVVLLRAGAQDETEALLTVPEGPGPFPVVILLSGSGPNDRDESAYGMAPFGDLAQGLTARGVATLRYDKYTLA